MIVNKHINNGIVAGYAFAKGVVDKLLKSFSSVTLTDTISYSYMNSMKFEIIDNILYLMVGSYWVGGGGSSVDLFDLETCEKIEVTCDSSMLPSSSPSCCVCNNELYYTSYSSSTYVLNSCKYNKETGELSIKTIKELDRSGILLTIEDVIFLCYLENNIFYMVNTETEETLTVSGFLKESESSDTSLSIGNMTYVNGNVYLSISENYEYKDLDSYVYYFAYDNTTTEFSVSLLASFDGKYTSYDGDITEGEYTNFIFVQYDFINDNPIAIVNLSDSVSVTNYTKIYDLTNKEWYAEKGNDVYNISLNTVQPYYFYNNVISYNNELYLIEYGTGLHKITFNYLLSGT